MGKFTGEYQETFTVDVPASVARDTLGKLENIAASYVGLERWEKLDDKTLHLVLEKQKALGAVFQGIYDCRYEWASENAFVWKSVDPIGNMESEGRAEFTPLGDRKTRIVYRDKVTCDIPISGLLAKALSPIVERGIRNGVKAYLDRMRKKM